MKSILHKTSLKFQLNLFITLGISTIIFIIILVNFDKSQQAMLTTEIKTNSELLNSETNVIDIYIDDIASFSLISWLNTEFNNILLSKEPLNYASSSVITEQVSKMLQSRSDIQGIKMYIKNKNKVFETNNLNRKTILSSADFYGFDNLPALDKVKLSPNYYYIESDPNNKNYFIFHRGIIDIETKEILCLISITFNDSYLNACLNSEHSSSIIKFLVHDDQVYYSNTNNNFELSRYDYNSNYYNVNDVEYFTNHAKSNNYNYEIIAFKNSDIMKKEIVHARNISILLAVFLIFISCLYTSVFISFITKPLYKLSTKLKDVGRGNFETKIDISGSSEIEDLAKSFNNMTEEINELINKTYLAKINENVAKLIALEAQINPHFLNNALQAISTEALLNDQDKIYEMVNTLAVMLRYTIKNDETVTINEELKHINQYMLMQKYRFGVKLEYEISVDALTNRDFIRIPKLSIQTLVENCIEHGMKLIEHNLLININIYTENKFTYIEVMDNGCGISKKDLARLNTRFADWQNTFKSEKENIGIANLYSRLKLLFNNKSTMEIVNVKPSGTLIVIKIPLSQEVL